MTTLPSVATTRTPANLAPPCACPTSRKPSVPRLGPEVLRGLSRNMPAVLTVDSRSGVPIYLQIIDQIKRSVALGVLQAGEQLPTVKQLALDLTDQPQYRRAGLPRTGARQRDRDRSRTRLVRPGRRSGRDRQDRRRRRRPRRRRRWRYAKPSRWDSPAARFAS